MKTEKEKKEKKENFKIDFQLFGNENAEVAGSEEEKAVSTAEPMKSYTEDEVRKLIDSKISIAYEKWEKQKKKAVLEAERLASLSEEDRQKEKIRSLEEALTQKEKDLAIRENTITLKDEMSKRNIPTELSRFLVSDNADEMFENLRIFDRSLKALVNGEVEKRISSTAPKGGNSIDVNAMTKEKFKALSLTEQQRLYESDRELYNSFVKN